MAPASPVAVVQRAVYQALVADATLVNMLARSPTGGPGISDQPQPNAKYPRVELGGWSAVPANMSGPRTGGAWGWQVSGQVKALSTYLGEAEGQAILARLVVVLHCPIPRLVVPGYADVEAWLTIEPSYPETVGNVIVRHFPTIVRVEVHER